MNPLFGPGVRVGSLFSGYGGLDMAVGGTLQWWSDIEPASVKVMSALHPGVPNLGNIKDVDWTQVAPVDVITGGYPCQPFSHAGLRKGTEDERHLWPNVREAIRILRPRLVVLENVRGHLSLGLDTVLREIADVGYSARWGVVRASDAGAPHGRARVFIAAYPVGVGFDGCGIEGTAGEAPIRWANAPGSADPAAHAHGGGHGEQQDPRGMGSLEAGAEGEAPERERTREVAYAGGIDPVPDAHRTGLQGADAGLDLRAGRGEAGGHPAQGGDDPATYADSAGRQARRDPGHNSRRFRTQPVGSSFTSWGQYEPAIRRWEAVTGEPAPLPTVRLEGKDRDRLNPDFVEWMMGLPPGHVTGHGLTSTQELKMLGNGVCPQQARLAIDLLLR